MKTIAKTKAVTPGRRPANRTRVATNPLTDEEFRRKLHLDLADEIAAGRKAAMERFGHLLRPHTPAEIKARSDVVRAMFAQWEKEDLKDPPPPDDWEKFKTLLEENRMRSAPIFAK